MTKKAHHYVPQTYLKGFTSDDGFLWVGRKDDPTNPLRIKPENIAFRNYYYSQHSEAGDLDNRMEDMFGNIETQWDELRRALTTGRRLTPHQVGQMWLSIGMQRVRVPAARDMMEAMLAHEAMLHAHQLDAAGELQPYPDGVPDIMEKLVIATDPQESIAGMPQMLRGFAALVGRIGFEILHNQTSINFITSDNPVAIFDPSISERVMRPYVISRSGGPVELIFPLDSRTLIRGHTSLQPRHSEKGPKHLKLKDPERVRRYNRLTAKFGYELIIASDDAHRSLLTAFAQTSPVLENAIGWSGGKQAGPLVMAFGPRPKKPKW